MKPMDLLFPHRVVCPENGIDQIGVEAAALGKRALLVTYTAGPLVDSGILDAVDRSLADSGVGVVHYGVEPEPTTHMLDRGAVESRAAGCDLVIGLGGGSVLDAAKGIAVLATHEYPIEDYQLGRQTLHQPGLPVIAVPTTAGTGSEVTQVVVLANEELGIKKSIGSPYLLPRVILLAPELTLGLSKELTLSTGLDALSHAMESYVSLDANPLTDAVGLHAIKMIGISLPRVVSHGQDSIARTSMLYASLLAGLSLNAGVGAAHILAQPVGAVTGISHSQAIAILLPHVVRANVDYAVHKYADIAHALGEGIEGLTCGEAAAQAVCAIGRLQSAGDLKVRFRDCGVTEQQLSDILENALRWQMHIGTNPRPADRALLESILAAAY